MRNDPLLANSVYLMLSTVTMGLFGFVFWAVAAHLYRPGQVGMATTLVTASILISYASQLGFNSTFVRFLPTAVERSEEINTGLVLVLGAALLVATGYIFIVPGFVPQLVGVRESKALALGFVAFCAMASLNLATDSVFIAFQEARFNLLVDGLLQGAVKVTTPVGLVALGGYGVYAATGWAAVLALGASLAIMVWRFGYRPRFQVSSRYLRRALRFSTANYGANLLNMVPILVLPLVVLRGLGAAPAAFFYIAFQLAGVVFAVAYSISQSTFAQGSQPGAALGDLMRRSARAEVATVLPAALALLVVARLVLLVFGRAYASHAARLGDPGLVGASGGPLRLGLCAAAPSP
jgi:O-antigen/teichoic acid export membrane protein